MTLDLVFEAWWESDGQYLRAGGGDYEKTFAYHAWIKAAQQSGPKYKCLDCKDSGVNSSNGFDCQYCFGDLRPRSLADAQAEIARRRGALERAISFVEHAEVSGGVCCCGDSIEGHRYPMNCGHSPRDMWDYASEGFINEMQALLK